MQSLNAPDVARTWAQFRRFYGELAAVEHECGSGSTRSVLSDLDHGAHNGDGDGNGAENGDGNDKGDGAGKGALSREVFTRLHRTLSELGFGGRRSGAHAGTALDAGYVMAALADEALLHRIDWAGQATWETMLLEDALYGTRIAGERIFAVAEEQAAGSSAFQPGLALAILLALQLGFRGRYRGVDDAGALHRLRLRLYELLCREPWTPAVDWQGTFAAASAPALTDDRFRYLPRLKPWLMAVAASMVGLLLITHGMWYRAVHSIVERADHVVVEGRQIVESQE
jgi:type VI secretion system protein ImpK